MEKVKTVINDVKAFKSELRLYNHYQEKKNYFLNLFNESFCGGKSPMATVDYYVYENGKLVQKSYIPTKTFPTIQEIRKMEFVRDEKREKLLVKIEYYQNKIDLVDRTLDILPTELKTIVFNVYIKKQTLTSEALKRNYSVSGFKRKIDIGLKKVLEN